MRIVITGGTGLIGSRLVPALIDQGYQVLVLARNTGKAKARLGTNVEIVKWDPSETDLDSNVLKDCHGVINLAGETINSRWTAARKERILDSRIKTTAGLVKAMEKMKQRPEVFINASAVGYYGPRNDERLSENASAGTDFLAAVCRKWEEEALKAKTMEVRVTILRLGVVLAPGDGALMQMLLPYRYFAGGPVGSGRQWFSWIHIEDLMKVIQYSLNNNTLEGPVNATAPQPVTNREFSRILGEVLHRPSWLPVPAFMMRLVFGEMADMLLNGQRVIPEKLLRSGFEFKYPDLRQALENLLGGTKLQDLH